MPIKSVAIDSEQFRKCKSIYDSHTAYFRLLAPLHSSATRLVYVDTDVVAFSQIERFLAEDLGKSPLGLSGGFPISRCDPREKQLLLKYGKAESDWYYGSGVALINPEAYRENKIAERCMQIVASDSGLLVNSDQSVWNAAIEDICPIGEACVVEAPPGRIKAGKTAPHAELTPEGIMHFWGSPKPWDLFGEFFHPHGSLWYCEALRCLSKATLASRYANPAFIGRAIRIRRQYRNQGWF